MFNSFIIRFKIQKQGNFTFIFDLSAVARLFVYLKEPCIQFYRSLKHQNNVQLHENRQNGETEQAAVSATVSEERRASLPLLPSTRLSEMSVAPTSPPVVSGTEQPEELVAPSSSPLVSQTILPTSRRQDRSRSSLTRRGHNVEISPVIL